MGFYELKVAMEPPPLVMIPSKVLGDEEASTAHPLDMWSFRSFVTKDRAQELHSQNSEFTHLKINLIRETEGEDICGRTHNSTNGGCLGARSNGRALWYGGDGGGGAFFTQYPIATKSRKSYSKRVLGGGDQGHLETSCWPGR